MGYTREVYQEAEEKMAQMRNSTKEMARGLLDARDAGKDPMDWLREQGYTNPEKAYQNIKARIKDRDPELAKRFPKMSMMYYAQNIHKRTWKNLFPSSKIILNKSIVTS